MSDQMFMAEVVQPVLIKDGGLATAHVPCSVTAWRSRRALASLFRA